MISWVRGMGDTMQAQANQAKKTGPKATSSHPAHLHAKTNSMNIRMEICSILVVTIPKWPLKRPKRENPAFLVIEGLSKGETKCDDVVYCQLENRQLEMQHSSSSS